MSWDHHEATCTTMAETWLLDDNNLSPGGCSLNLFAIFKTTCVTGLCLNTCGVLYWIGFPDEFQFPWNKLEPLDDLEMVNTI